MDDVAVQKIILLMQNFVAFLQLDFSDDIVKIIQAAINSDGGQPEVKKANSMVKSFFIRVSSYFEICFVLCHCL